MKGMGCPDTSVKYRMPIPNMECTHCDKPNLFNCYAIWGHLPSKCQQICWMLRGGLEWDLDALVERRSGLRTWKSSRFILLWIARITERTISRYGRGKIERLGLRLWHWVEYVSMAVARSQGNRCWLGHQCRHNRLVVRWGNMERNWFTWPLWFYLVLSRLCNIQHGQHEAWSKYHGWSANLRASYQRSGGDKIRVKQNSEIAPELWVDHGEPKGINANYGFREESPSSHGFILSIWWH